MTPREHQRVRVAAVEAFGDTPEVQALLARYRVVPELVAVPRESYAAAAAREAVHVRARLVSYGARARSSR